MPHVDVKRMWEYAHGRLKLTSEESAHVPSCDACHRLLQICLHVVNPKKKGNEEKERRSA